MKKTFMTGGTPVFLAGDQNTQSLRNRFSDIQMGAAAEFQAGLIGFPEAEILIATGHLAGWMVKEPGGVNEAGHPQPAAGSGGGVGGVRRQAKGGTAFYRAWTGISEAVELAEPLAEINRVLTEFKAAVSAGDEEGAAVRLGHLLGKGEGLTPSGDDLVVGLLLAARRYPRCCDPLLANPAWVQRILRLARQKTTWLGACLVESAAEGQADERLVIGLDGIVTGHPGPEKQPGCCGLMAAARVGMPCWGWPWRCNKIAYPQALFLGAVECPHPRPLHLGTMPPATTCGPVRQGGAGPQIGEGRCF